jgi:hypothetical protein
MTAEGFRRWYGSYVPGPGDLFNLHEGEEGSVGEDEERDEVEDLSNELEDARIEEV